MGKIIIVSILFGLILGTGVALANTENVSVWEAKKVEEIEIVYLPENDLFCGLDDVVCKGEEMPEILPLVITKDVVIEEIKRQVKLGGVNEEIALRIAKCESGYNDKATNKTSTAKGVYQFIDGTWGKYCFGDVLNYKDNIACFIKYYPKFPGWWVCR